ncbi:bifunctional folylpolyglutamate synthase/dihydrofolate synthase [Bacillus methanolicus]|uniref:bifunctional folylpolyglutamate synthase/dihydrofolate synthase n=1 Tax=Bacillus methanolicus TaxID=1471 RepID=UPI0023803E74|nr:folylpolyglutamate synthase/dihydrofolate synthase family protein [Bacillus methanolicus]MDE3839789.1 bifunctional folylpolyglutamate synthase/dihydrofolate synthase [Bacillus methanolicus]
MFHTYSEALNWIHSRLRLGMKPGLKRMEWMMEKLNHPEREIRTVHIGGTNGKGSTVTFLRSILQNAGYSVGTFTSPYFEQFNERISVNGKPVTDQEIIELANVIFPLAEELEKTELGGPTEFEVVTAMSIYYFSKVNPVDIVIFEVGLGGRFDSTNIIYPLLSIITNIGMDHTNILGHSLREIAFEKAGIIKNGVPVATAAKQAEALNVIKEQADSKKASLFQLGNDILIKDCSSLPKGERFTVSTLFKSFPEMQIEMIGQHQIENAALAVMASELLVQYYSFQIEEKHVRKGLLSARWPGRFEILSENPFVVIDGAHNEEGITALINEIKNRFKEKKIKILFAALKDKKLDNMIAKLDRIAEKITFTDFDFPRAASSQELLKLSKSVNKHAVQDWKAFLQTEIEQLKEQEVLVITGSLYFLSEVRSELVDLLRN